jgi:hypothetical protein
LQFEIVTACDKPAPIPDPFSPDSFGFGRPRYSQRNHANRRHASWRFDRAAAEEQAETPRFQKNVSNAGFAFLDARAQKQQIAFDDIASVKQVGVSHVKRNVLICVGVAAAAAVIPFVAYALALGKLGHST